MEAKELFQKALGKILRQQRYLEGIKKETLEQLSSKTDIPDNYLGKIERGEKPANAHMLYKMFVKCGISIDQLFNELNRQLEMQEKTGKKV